jgi:uncharacterized protein HemX
MDNNTATPVAPQPTVPSAPQTSVVPQVTPVEPQVQQQVVTPPVSEPSSVIPPLQQTPPVKSNMGRNLVVAISAILILAVLAGVGYMMFLGNAKKTTHTAKVYAQPTVAATPTVMPMQSSDYQVNVKDTSNSAIDQDTQAADQNLNNIDKDLNNVDQSLNDQQTNLQ